MSLLAVVGVIAVAVLLLLGWRAYSVGRIAGLGVRQYAKAYARNSVLQARLYRGHTPGAPLADVFRHVVQVRRGFEPLAASFLERIGHSEFDSLNALVVEMARAEYGQMGGDPWDPDVICKVLDGVASIIPGSAFQVLESRPRWKSMDFEFLRMLGDRLGSIDNALDFAALCERSGILRNNIERMGRSHGDPDFICGLVATTLTQYANHVGGREGRFGEMRHAAELAVLLKPRYVPAWFMMALAAYNCGDRAAAATWADKLLDFEPDATSRDIWERTLGGTEPDLVESLEDMRATVRELKKACAEAEGQ